VGGPSIVGGLGPWTPAPQIRPWEDSFNYGVGVSCVGSRSWKDWAFKNWREAARADL